MYLLRLYFVCEYNFEMDVDFLGLTEYIQGGVVFHMCSNFENEFQGSGARIAKNEFPSDHDKVFLYFLFLYTG